MSADDPKAAMAYLQKDLAAVIDHNNPAETDEFHMLASSLFKCDMDEEEMYEYQTSLVGTNDVSQQYLKRTELFDQLVEFFPENMTQPKGNLVDLIPLC